MEGWLLKQSGGKVGKASVGNRLAKYDRRWFVFDPARARLSYYKSDKDPRSSRPPAGILECRGCTVEATGELFRLRTAERTLTLKADDPASLDAWVQCLLQHGAVAAPSARSTSIGSVPLATPPREAEEEGGRAASARTAPPQMAHAASLDQIIGEVEADDLSEGEPPPPAVAEEAEEAEEAKAGEAAEEAKEAKAGEPTAGEVVPQLPPPLPQSGYLFKQSGGKADKSSLGNRLQKWDKRWFAIAADSTRLCYYKSHVDRQNGRGPVGYVDCVDASVERVGGEGELTFAISTPERVLTVRAESEQSVQAWVRAILAAGGWTDEAALAFERDSAMTSGGAAAEAAEAAGGALANGAAPLEGGEAALVRTSATAMPGMEGYLVKQSGGRGGSSKGEILKKWDRRYFVLRAGETKLRYYRSTDDFRAGKEPAGLLDTAGAHLKVEREPAVFEINLITPLRTLSIRADSATTLEHWVMALSCGSRAKDVERGSYGVTESSPAESLGSPAMSNPVSRIEAGRPVKILLVGDAGVGKTCVLQRFSEGTFVTSTRATVGMDLKRTLVDLDGSGERITLQIWDTAGQEMFRSIISSYYRGAHGVILMFDVCRKPTFDALEGWLNEVRRVVRQVRSRCDESAAIVLVGNKVDADGREVSYETAVAWAKKNSLPYIETSAKRDVMITDAFITLVATVAGRTGEISLLLKKAKVMSGQSVATNQVLPLPKQQPQAGGGCAC
ncbi:hypothetical protein AB1Y20_006535 [Prymnesium parvum]|uniref:PH domain-containing protein n=1 Tax=Prymnesium parvum TaxID=97485 RepID=A0AB34IZX5_PRYPA